MTESSRILKDNEQQDRETTKRFHRFLKEFQERIDHFKPNTAISACMEWLNDAQTQNMRFDKKTLEQLLVILSVMIPHMASELLEKLLDKQLQDCPWPTYDATLATPDEIPIVVQINGKMRVQIMVVPGTSREQIQPLAEMTAQKWLEGKKIVHIVFVPDRLINFVVQ